MSRIQSTHRSVSLTYSVVIIQYTFTSNTYWFLLLSTVSRPYSLFKMFKHYANSIYLNIYCLNNLKWIQHFTLNPHIHICIYTLKI